MPKKSAAMQVDDALDTAEEFWGPKYGEVNPGRFVSEDGARPVRMGIGDITGQHAGAAYINLD